VPRLRSVADLPPWSARILFNDVPESQLEAHPDWVLVNEGVDALQALGFDAQPAEKPASGWVWARIPAEAAATAEERGLTTWDAKGCLILALSSVLRHKAADCLVIETVQTLLDQVGSYWPQLVAETVPKTLPLFLLTDVLRRLVTEGVSIRNLRRILLTLADWGRVEQDPLYLAEYARAGLQRQITQKVGRGNRNLPVFLLDPEIESRIESHTRFTATGSYIDLPPDQLRAILEAIREPMQALPDNVQIPQILTTVAVRSYVRRLVAPSLPKLHAVSYLELTPEVNIQPIGRICVDGFRGREVHAGGVKLWGRTTAPDTVVDR
jgi:type III secretion protein V